MSSFRKVVAGVIVGVGTIAGVSGAQATVIEYEWTGTIVDPGTLESGHGVSAGDPISGSFFYDNLTPGGPPGPGGGGGSSFANAISSHSFSVGSFSGTFFGMMVATFDNTPPAGT